MIKKSLFEDELIHGMQRELQPHDKKQGMNNLVQAVEYLHSAAQILEDSGLTAKADQIIRILGKIALAEASKEEEDKSAADDQESDDFYNKVMKWIEDPQTPVDPENPQENEEISFKSLLHEPKKEIKPGDEISFKSLLGPSKDMPAEESGEDLVFKSIAEELGLTDGKKKVLSADDNDARGKPRKPKNPLSIKDPHTHGLTPEKMVENLKHHGTEFNMADDQGADDLLDLDISENELGLMEDGSGKTFEDSD